MNYTKKIRIIDNLTDAIRCAADGCTDVMTSNWTAEDVEAVIGELQDAAANLETIVAEIRAEESGDR